MYARSILFKIWKIFLINSINHTQQISASLSKSKKAVQRQMLDTSTNTEDGQRNLDPNKIADFLTKQEQQRIFSEFLIKRKIEEKRRYKYTKQAQRQEMVNDYEEVDSDYEDDNDNVRSDEFYDEYSDEFEDEK